MQLLNLFKKTTEVKSIPIMVMEETLTSRSESDQLTLRIHKEIDDAELLITDEIRSFLKSVNISTEKQLKDKADLAASLGFTNCTSVLKFKSLEDNNESIIVQKIENENLLNRFSELKNRYPLEKFITLKKFESILEKYNLIYAHCKHYIKDIPEKNLLEIKNCKPLSGSDIMRNQFSYQFKFYDYVPKPVREWFNNAIFNEEVRSDSKFQRLCPIKYPGEYLYQSGDSALIERKIRKNGYFVAAPPNHFNLDDLKQENNNKYGYFEVDETVINKDPIVFEFVKDNIVRIITKWGTSDDQSYLDPVIQNENHN